MERLQYMEKIPSVDEILERAHFISLPMRCTFRGINTRELVLIDGPAGWGEFAPFVEYEPQEAATWLKAGLESSWQGIPTPIRSRIPINATIPAVEPEEVAPLLARYPGVKTVKVKVAEKGHSRADDYARIQAVRDCAPDIAIRIDANCGWTVEEALQAARALEPLDYMEQPVATVQEMLALKKHLAAEKLMVRIAADEAIRRATDPLTVIKNHAAEVAVLKTAPLGGATATLEWIRILKENNISVTIASALDSAVGMNIPLAVAGASPIETNPAGLGTGSLFVEDIAPARPIINGSISTHAIEPEKERLQELKMSTSRQEWWINRIHACMEYIK